MTGEAWILAVGLVIASLLIGLGIESGAKIIAEAINPPVDDLPTVKELEKMPRPDPRGDKKI